MRIVLYVFLLLFTLTVRGQQFAFDYWHEGRLVLEEGDTLKGKIKYNMQTDLLQLEINNRLESYTARKVVYFEIFDVTVKMYRQFFTLPYSPTGGYEAPIFFELLADGKLTVLCRETVEYRTYSSFYYYGSYTRLVLVNKYFILDERGDLVEFSGTKNDWLVLMGRYAEEVQKYAKSNHLEFDKKSELSAIVAYYNSLAGNK